MKLQSWSAVHKLSNFEAHVPSILLAEEHNATSFEIVKKNLRFKKTIKCLNSFSYSRSGHGFVARDSRPTLSRILAVHLVISNG